MLNSDAAERVSNVRRKMKMANYHRSQLLALKGQWPSLDDEELEIRTAAHLEGGLHCLHHCLDILAHAILLQRKSQLQIKGDVSFSNVLRALSEALDDSDPLLVACKVLSTHPEAQWLRAFVNHAKHHNLIRISRLIIYGSAGTAPYLPDVFVDGFVYKGHEYSPTFAIAIADTIWPALTDHIESVITALG